MKLNLLLPHLYALLVLLFTAAARADVPVESPLDPKVRLAPASPGMGVYLIVTSDSGPPVDVSSIGGRVLQSWHGRLVVELPAAAAASLADHEGVAYVQRIWTGEPLESVASPPPAQRPLRTVANAAARPPAWSTGTYQYDGSGNIKAIGGDRYGYDAVGRLIDATVQQQTESYAYDAFGNLTALGPRALYVNAADNRLAAPFQYDDTGNLTVDDQNRVYHYDAVGMVTAIDTVNDDRRMIYTADDERIVIEEEVGATSRYRLRDIDGKQVLIEWRRSHATNVLEFERDYVHAEGQLVAGSRQAGTNQDGFRHYHLDHLGSIRMVTDGAGALVARHDYWPFGAELTSTTTEFDNTNLAPRDPRKFTSHERDYFTGANVPGDYVDYMHARYYGPGWGRFLSVDPGKDWDSTKPQTWNIYMYARSNPVLLMDPNGRAVAERLPNDTPASTSVVEQIERRKLPRKDVETKGAVTVAISGEGSALQMTGGQNEGQWFAMVRGGLGKGGGAKYDRTAQVPRPNDGSAPPRVFLGLAASASVAVGPYSFDFTIRTGVVIYETPNGMPAIDGHGTAGPKFTMKWKEGFGLSAGGTAGYEAGITHDVIWRRKD